MKYNIKSNTINVEYIADGKRKQLTLKNNDKTDMDFFNQLLSAKSSKRDAMCELYRRKILKEYDQDTVLIHPLKLDKELKPSKYQEKEELRRRKTELDQDKKYIKTEIDQLLKIDSKNKEVKDLTKSDLNNETDEQLLKDLMQKYIEIEKVHQMIVNQIESLDITTADTVNIKELKNLTVNAYENINKSIMETKLSEEDKQKLVNSIAESIRPNLDEITNAIRGSIRVMKEGIQKITTNTDVNYTMAQEQLNTLYANLISIVAISRNGLAKQESLDQIQESLDDIQSEIDNIKSADYSTELDEIIKKLDDIEDSLLKIEPVANKEALKETEENIIDAINMSRSETNRFLNLPADLWYPYTQLLKKYTSIITDNIISIEQLIDNEILKKPNNQQTGYKLKNMPANQCYEEPCFYTDKALYLTRDSFMSSPFTQFSDIQPIKLAKKKSNTRGEQFNTVDYYIIHRNRIEGLKVYDIIDFLTTQSIRRAKNIFVQHYPKNKPISYLCIQRTTTLSDYAYYINNVKCIRQTDGTIQNLLNMRKKWELDEDPEETQEEGSSEGLSGKINIDLNKSSTDEKLNEIIRLLSQMNYNLFTTTPMYANRRSAKRKSQNEKSDRMPSKGLDLLEIISE